MQLEKNVTDEGNRHFYSLQIHSWVFFVALSDWAYTLWIVPIRN
jgi:hypothetical protein